MMRACHVIVSRDFRAPVSALFAHLSEHENLSSLFGLPVRRLRSGELERNGVGSRRGLGPPGPLGFEETVTDFVPDELIVYRITRGSPLRGHEGVMRFTPGPGGGSHLDYRIRLASPVPGLAPALRGVLQRSIERGLQRLDGTL